MHVIGIVPMMILTYITLPTPHWLRTVTLAVIRANQKVPRAAVTVLQTRSIYISTGINALFISRLVYMSYLYLDWYRCPFHISTS